MNERERRAFNRGIESAAKLVELWTDENIRMANETILADPILNGSARRETLESDLRRSEVLQIQATGHAAVYHAGLAMASMIRGQKVKA